MNINETKKFSPVFHPALNYDKTKTPNLITVVLQNFSTREVLYGATMNQEALEKTLDTRRVYLYSRSAKKVRLKGATSGDFLQVMNILTNCNQDCLLMQVKPLGENGGVCHTKNKDSKHRTTCFYRIMGCIVGKTTEYSFTHLEK